MSLYKTITLTEKGAKAGPTFEVYWSADGLTFLFLQTITLSFIGDNRIIILPDNAISIRLVSVSTCTNSVTNPIPGITLGDFALDFNQYDFD